MPSILDIHRNCSDQNNDYKNLKQLLQLINDPKEMHRLLNSKNNGETPFSIACRAGSLRTVELLLSHGAEIEASALQETSDEIREACGGHSLVQRLQPY